ncbi:unnamed protein product [Aureobasidium pullulans]|nr:unnamed protein product [Aureobasidium pullulans]
MKPVVSAFNAWTCVVISVFAIVILSIIGALFKTNNHSLMGSEEDPEDGAAVAASVFGAVAIYGLICTNETDQEAPSHCHDPSPTAHNLTSSSRILDTKS